MSVKVNITKPIDNDYVQVEATSSGYGTRYYRVKKDIADSFCKSYKEDTKYNRLVGDVSMFGFSLLFGSVAYKLCSKMNNQILKYVSCVLGSVAGCTLGVYLGGKYVKNVYDKLMHKYHATEIDVYSSYEDKLPPELRPDVK